MSEHLAGLTVLGMRHKAAALGIAVGTLIGCGEDNKNVDIPSFADTQSSVISDVANDIVPVTDSTVRAPIDSPATALSSAERLNTPKKYDCSNMRFVVFGNSVDSDFGVVNRTDRWPAGMQDNLNFSPYIDNVTILNKAVPGSGIMSPTIYRAKPMTEYAKEFIATYKDTLPANTTVIIHPSYIEMTYFPEGASAQDVANRATMGVMAVVGDLKKSGYNVIVVPTAPITKKANERLMSLSKARNDVNAAIKLLNENLSKLGMTPIEMKYNPLADINHKDAIDKYYADVALNSLAPYYAQQPGGDGLHPGPSGEHLLANEIAKLNLVYSALTKTCKVRR